MAVQRIDLLNHSFSRSLRGYNSAEVDEFLQDVADTVARLNDERIRLLNRIHQLEEQVKEYAQRESSLHITLLSSQKLAEEMKFTAQKEAQIIIDAAQTKAESLTSQANMRLARILEDISAARRLKAQFEFKLRSVIEGHLKLLELGQMEDQKIEKATNSLSSLIEDKIDPTTD